MPIPAGFDNTVLLASNVIADINTAIAARNAAGYWLTDLKFFSDGSVALLFVKNNMAALGFSGDQKVNAVASNQVAIDADKATEIALGYWPTGIFISPDDVLLLLYQLLDPPSV